MPFDFSTRFGVGYCDNHGIHTERGLRPSLQWKILLSPPGDARRYPTEELAFNDETNPSLKTRISEILWCWKFAPECERDAIVADTHLTLLVEHWFPFSDVPLTRRLGTWCDGISTLEIEPTTRLSFLLAGVGWFPTYLAPFELEFHFPKRRSTLADSIVLRLGFHGKLRPANARGVPSSRDDSAAFAKRPRYNRDWAVAVELTPGGG